VVFSTDLQVKAGHVRDTMLVGLHNEASGCGRDPTIRDAGEFLEIESREGVPVLDLRPSSRLRVACDDGDHEMEIIG
jgi:hypothetical protein